MALKLRADTEYGVAVEYWRLGMREEHIVGKASQGDDARLPQ